MGAKGKIENVGTLGFVEGFWHHFAMGPTISSISRLTELEPRPVWLERYCFSHELHGGAPKINEVASALHPAGGHWSRLLSKDDVPMTVPDATEHRTGDVAFGEGIVRIPRYNNVVAKATYGFAPTPHFQR